MTQKKNSVGFIDQYNRLFEGIGKASTADDMRELLSSVKGFISMYKGIDKEGVQRIYDKFLEKLQGLIVENSLMYDRMLERSNEINTREYDFSNDTDDSQAVNAKVLQLMAELPSARTTANAGSISNLIMRTVNSGMVGCKAVLELLKYPAYADMVNAKAKETALFGSKSSAQIAFDNLKATELKEVETARTHIYLEGFHLRNMEKTALSFKKPTAWSTAQR